MKILKITGNICLIFLAILSVLVTSGYFYYHYFVHDFISGTNYIDNQVPVDLIEHVDDLTSEELDYYENRYLFNVNYYSNSKNNGIELQEMQLNYFTDPTLNLSSIRSTGMQYIGSFEEYRVNVDSVDSAENYVVPDFYYYDTTNMISWSGGKVATQLNRNQKFIIKIDNKPYMIQLTAKKDEYSQLLFWKVHKGTIYYDYGSVFYDVMNAVKSNNKGFGDFYITVDLSNYFTVYEFDESSNKWIEDNITDDIFTYSVLKFHYDENGAINSDQSIYGLIECNSNYGKSEDVNTTYWQERYILNLSVDDLSFRYSEKYNGNFVSVSLNLKNSLIGMKKCKINIFIDLNSDYLISKNLKIIGFDYNGFENVPIDTITIVGEPQNFILLDKSLFNTNASVIQHSKDIEISILDNAINFEYKEVLL